MTAYPSASPDNELLTAIIDSLPVPTFGINPAGVIVAWNRAMENLSGVTAEEILGKGNYEHGLRLYGTRRPTLLDFVQSPDDEVRKWYPDFERGTNQITAEAEIRFSGKEPVYLRSTAAVILSSDNKPLGFIQNLTDLTTYKKTETELIRQRESLTTVLEHSPVGTAIVDSTGKITYLNQRTIDITGYTIEEIPTNDAWFKLAYPSDQYRKALVDNWNRQLAETGQARGTARIINKEGQVKYLDFQAVRLWDGRDINSIWDLTPQKKIEEELRSSEEKLKALSEASLEGILFLENGYCVEASKKGAEMLGYEYDEIIGIPTKELVAPESRQMVEQNVDSSYILPYEITALRKDGSRLPMEVQGRTFFYMGRTVRATVMNDLSERKRAQEQIEIQNRNLASLFSGSPYGLVFANIDHLIVDVNPRFTEIFGFERQECVGNKLIDLIVPEGFIAEYDYNAFEASLANPITMETIRKNKRGEFIEVLVNVVPVTNFGCYVMYMDIRERKRNEKVIQHQLQELETKNAEMERFTYTVSHDLRSPLITIQGFSTLLLEDIKNGEFKRLESDLTRVINAASKMDQLLQDLLELSRIGRMLNPLSVFPMVTLVDEVVELLNGPITKSGVKVVMNDDFPMVKADRSRIQEVLQNLIENAIKFMGDQIDPEIRIGYLPERGENIFFVKDNGMGIESVYLDKIFGLFEQLDATNEGTGIGLALVKRIIEFHEGRIWVESEGLGKGSCFFFTLPEITN